MSSANSPIHPLQKLLRSRRTAHDFLPDPVPADVIDRALACAIRAPNHYLTNPWRFRLLGPQTQHAIAQANAELVRKKHGDDAARKKLERWLGVPGWLLVTSLRDADRQRDRENYAATCCAVHNFVLALHAEDFACKWTSGPVTQQPGFPKLVGYSDDDESFVGLIWFGRAARKMAATKRRPVSEVFATRP